LLVPICSAEVDRDGSFRTFIRVDVFLTQLHQLLDLMRIVGRDIICPIIAFLVGSRLRRSFHLLAPFNRQHPLGGSGARPTGICSLRASDF
jgi:hypothetical protein